LNNDFLGDIQNAQERSDNNPSSIFARCAVNQNRVIQNRVNEYSYDTIQPSPHIGLVSVISLLIISCRAVKVSYTKVIVVALRAQINDRPWRKDILCGDHVIKFSTP